MTVKEKRWNLPNLLSGYRILAFPVILYLILTGQRTPFIVMLCINLVTDIADGYIARRFNLATEFGARLDSIADLGTYFLAFTGMLVIEHVFVQAHWVAFVLVMGLYVLQLLVCLARFRRPPHLHVYSAKLTGYLQGIFMLTYFACGYTAWYFYLMIAVTCIAYLEELLILLLIPALRSNVKGIYFMIKEHGSVK
jgi:CDP-diacylglycerol--glycerol-3-phosphate 3-phosphatidyltransferase